MPSFEFQGFVPTVYPYVRDANGRPLGTVEPGDIRFLDEDLGWPWVPVIPSGTNETGSEASGAGDNQRGGIESAPDPADVPASPADAPEPEPAAGPVPAPPAVVPSAGPTFAVTTDQGA